MKKIPLILLLFVIEISFSQKTDIEKLLIEGNQSYQNSDFETAKLKYEAIIKIDSINKDALFNLAGTELSLGNTNKACSILQKSYSLGDFGAYDLIKKYCDELEYSEQMFLFHVDELPKFKYKTEFEPLIINRNEINPKYIKLLKSEIKNSKSLKRINGKIYIMINVDINGNLITVIKGELSDVQKTDFTNVLNQMTKYKPATYKGMNVGLFGGGFTLPLNM